MCKFMAEVGRFSQSVKCLYVMLELFIEMLATNFLTGK